MNTIRAAWNGNVRLKLKSAAARPLVHKNTLASTLSATVALSSHSKLSHIIFKKHSIVFVLVFFFCQLRCGMENPLRTEARVVRLALNMGFLHF